jgi:hypothetical protein
MIYGLVLLGLLWLIAMYWIVRQYFQLADLRNDVEHEKNREEGEWLAYRLAREYCPDIQDEKELEKYVRYEYPSNIKVVGRAQTIGGILTETYIGQALTIEQAKQRLDNLIAKKHEEDCLVLSKDEEKSILAKRRRDLDRRFVEVKPRNPRGKKK